LQSAQQRSRKSRLIATVGRQLRPRVAGAGRGRRHDDVGGAQTQFPGARKYRAEFISGPRL